MCVSKMFNSNYGVSVCVSAFLHRASIITVNFSVILFLIFFNSEMKNINYAKRKLRKNESMKQVYRADDVKTPSQKFKKKL